MDATFEDWWGLLVFVFFILAFAVFIIKIIIEYPGLLSIKFVGSGESNENLIEEVDQQVEVELNNVSNSFKKRRIKPIIECTTIVSENSKAFINYSFAEVKCKKTMLILNSPILVKVGLGPELCNIASSCLPHSTDV